jgi:oligopeptide transport system permease protein
MNEEIMPKKAPLSLQIDLKKFEKATDEEKIQQDVMTESTSFFRDGMRRLMRNPLAVMSLILLAAIIIVILVAPMIVPYGYEEMLSINGKRDKGDRIKQLYAWGFDKDSDDYKFYTQLKY